MTNATMNLSFSARTFFRLHLSAITILVVLHFMFTAHYARTDSMQTLWRLFWLSGEANIPAFFSSVMLLISAIMSGIILANADNPTNRIGWRVTAGLLFFMALDEAALVHERLQWIVEGERIRLMWMLVYLPFIIAGSTILLPFCLRLPPPVRNGSILGGLLFSLGAVGVEFQEGNHAISGLDYWANIPLVLSITIEESLEMTGVAIALYAMLCHLALVQPEPLQIQFRA